MIGIDLGSHSIKLCWLSGTDGTLRVGGAVRGIVPLDSDEARQRSETVRRIREMLKNSRPGVKSAALSFGGPEILARNFVFPALSREELAGAVALEAGQSVLSDLNTMYSDFQVLGPAEGGKLDVLFVAVPRAEADRRLELVQEAGLDPVIMDVDNLALANCFMAFDPERAKRSVALLNIGHTITNLVVIDNRRLCLVRSVPFGGKSVSAEIANRFEIPADIAEEVKKLPELWGEIGLNMKSVLKKSMPDLLEAVYRSIDYCMNRKMIVNIDEILVTGGTSALKGIDEFIAEVLGIKTERWNPLDRCEAGASCRKEKGHYLSIALGLAVRGGGNV